MATTEGERRRWVRFGARQQSSVGQVQVTQRHHLTPSDGPPSEPRPCRWATPLSAARRLPCVCGHYLLRDVSAGCVCALQTAACGLGRRQRGWVSSLYILRQRAERALWVVSRCRYFSFSRCLGFRTWDTYAAHASNELARHRCECVGPPTRLSSPTTEQHWGSLRKKGRSRHSICRKASALPPVTHPLPHPSSTPTSPRSLQQSLIIQARSWSRQSTQLPHVPWGGLLRAVREETNPARPP